MTQVGRAIAFHPGEDARITLERLYETLRGDLPTLARDLRINSHRDALGPARFTVTWDIPEGAHARRQDELDPHTDPLAQGRWQNAWAWQAATNGAPAPNLRQAFRFAGIPIEGPRIDAFYVDEAVPGPPAAPKSIHRGWPGTP